MPMTILSDDDKQAKIDEVMDLVRPLDEQDSIIVTADAFFHVWRASCVIHEIPADEMKSGLMEMFEMFLEQNPHFTIVKS